MKKIIREFCEESMTAVVRMDAYSDSFEKISELVFVAKSDFPNLKDEDIEVKRYSGRHYARTFGIEFHSETAPATYKRISGLEFTF